MRRGNKDAREAHPKEAATSWVSHARLPLPINSRGPATRCASFCLSYPYRCFRYLNYWMLSVECSMKSCFLGLTCCTAWAS